MKHYGFARIQMARGLRIERVGAAANADRVNNITVVFFGRNPQTGGQYIIGWYQHATLLKKHNKVHNIPAILKSNYELIFRFDAESLLNYYKGIFTNSALERITGINQRQLQHYGSGLKKPRPAQNKKIETALHRLGSELMAVVL